MSNHLFVSTQISSSLCRALLSPNRQGIVERPSFKHPLIFILHNGHKELTIESIPITVFSQGLVNCDC